MTLTIDGMEIEVKVKKNGRANAEETKRFLNKLSSLYFESAERVRDNGFNAYADAESRRARDIYDFLDGLGYYDDVK